MRRLAMVALIVLSALLVEWSGVEAVAPMGGSESTPSVGHATVCVARTECRTASLPSASPVPETPYDCKRFPPKTRRWQRYGYSICMHGPGWQRVRIRCVRPGDTVFIIRAWGGYVRSHDVNPANDLSIQWCPDGFFARRVRIERLPDLGMVTP